MNKKTEIENLKKRVKKLEDDTNFYAFGVPLYSLKDVVKLLLNHFALEVNMNIPPLSLKRREEKT